jgi:hypothetical protein
MPASSSTIFLDESIPGPTSIPQSQSQDLVIHRRLGLGWKRYRCQRKVNWENREMRNLIGHGAIAASKGADREFPDDPYPDAGYGLVHLPTITPVEDPDAVIETWLQARRQVYGSGCPNEYGCS